MTQDMNAKRVQVIDRLNQSGFKPETIEQILEIIDLIMTGRAPLAYVLVAATEVCKVCELSRTHRHVANALACVASEVLQYMDPSVDDESGAYSPTPLGTDCWNGTLPRRVKQAMA